jgi:hypothetical protein
MAVGVGDILISLLVAGLFSIFVAGAALSRKGEFAGGTAGGLIGGHVALLIATAVVLWVFYKDMLLANILTIQIVLTCLALFLALSAVQIAYIQQISA